METGEEGKEIQALVRIYIWFYSRSFKTLITLVHHCVHWAHWAFAREKLASLTKHDRKQSRLPERVIRSTTHQLSLKATVHRLRDIKDGHTDPESRVIESCLHRQIDIEMRTDIQSESVARVTANQACSYARGSLAWQSWPSNVYRSETFFGISPPLPAKKSNALVIGCMVISSLDKSANRGTSENNGRWRNTERMELNSMFLSGTFRENLKFFKYSDTIERFNNRTVKVIKMINS